MRKSLLIFTMAASAAFAQYKLEPAGAAPAELPAAFKNVLASDGYKVAGGGDKVVGEFWLVKSAPTGRQNEEEGVDVPGVPIGSLMGILRLTEKGEDRRGQNLAPGIYTLRYAWHPVNGDHQGVALQRDFLVLSPLAEDKDPAAKPSFEELMKMSRKASGTPHPAVLGLWKSRHEKLPEVAPEGDTDWVLHAKAGDLPLAIIVVGRSEH